MSSPRLAPLRRPEEPAAPFLIAIDLDGTLLGPDHHISAANAAAVRWAQQQGHQIVIATGRAAQDARLLLDEIGVRCPVISSNGALTTGADGQVLRTVPLPTGRALALLPQTADTDWYVELYTQRGTYVLPQPTERLRRDQQRALAQRSEDERAQAWTYAQAHLVQNGVAQVESFREVLDDPAQVLLKLLAFTFAQDRLQALARDAEPLGLTVTHSSPYNLEFTDPEAQKGTALAALAHRLGWPMSRTVAIGDSANDLSMMRVSGHAVAMGGAHEVIRTACHSVARRCEEDGVAHALSDLLGGETAASPLRLRD